VRGISFAIIDFLLSLFIIRAKIITAASKGCRINFHGRGIMKVYHYDDKYAGKNGVNGVKELVGAVCVGSAGAITAATLMGLDIVSLGPGMLIIAFTALVTGLLIRRMSIILRASMSAIVDRDGALYYVTLTPNLRGSSLPSSVSAFLAGPSAIYAENSVNAQAAATNLAQSDEVVLYLLDLLLADKIKTTFDTVMYGKPVTVYELLDQDFAGRSKKICRVKCIRNKKRQTTVCIPRAFPEFFE
jgi:hypothetical protein